MILEYKLQLPQWVNSDAADVIARLLEKDPTKRIACGIEGADEIKRHAWFRDIDWDRLIERKVTPPFVPKIKTARDTSNFDEEFTNEMAQETPMETSALIKMHQNN